MANFVKLSKALSVPRCILKRGVSIYALVDAAGYVVYVGATSASLADRLERHLAEPVSRVMAN